MRTKKPSATDGQNDNPGVYAFVFIVMLLSFIQISLQNHVTETARTKIQINLTNKKGLKKNLIRERKTSKRRLTFCLPLLPFSPLFIENA